MRLDAVVVGGGQAGLAMAWHLHRRGLRVVVLDAGTSRGRLERAGVRFRPRLKDGEGRTARYADGGTLEVGAVVWATGFRSDHSWVHVPGVVAGGRVVHRRGVTDVPGLYLLGLSWQHTRGSALLGFVKDDTAYLADRIAERQQATTAADSG
jgi:putative flavoprotein involved in K+ transport